MKINEVEAKAGITKKNIRFYEEQGLLSPKRNSENGYREYSEAEVHTLQRIKLLRKLGVPIEEIRQMFQGTYTVADGMRRHLISIEREQKNLEQSILLCRELQKQDINVAELNAEEILLQMEEMEKDGTAFQNKHTQDVRMQYIAPTVIAILMVSFMSAIIALILWAYKAAPQEAPPIWFLVLVIAILAAVGAGVMIALKQRIKEIVKGEIDDAKRF